MRLSEIDGSEDELNYWLDPIMDESINFRLFLWNIAEFLYAHIQPVNEWSRKCITLLDGEVSDTDIMVHYEIEGHDSYDMLRSREVWIVFPISDIKKISMAPEKFVFDGDTDEYNSSVYRLTISGGKKVEFDQHRWKLS